MSDPVPVEAVEEGSKRAPESDMEAPAAKKTKKLTAWYWEHFEKVGEKNEFVKCKVTFFLFFFFSPFLVC